jgi:hypothetical protein
MAMLSIAKFLSELRVRENTREKCSQQEWKRAYINSITDIDWLASGKNQKPVPLLKSVVSPRPEYISVYQAHIEALIEISQLKDKTAQVKLVTKPLPVLRILASSHTIDDLMEWVYVMATPQGEDLIPEMQIWLNALTTAEKGNVLKLLYEHLSKILSLSVRIPDNPMLMLQTDLQFLKLLHVDKFITALVKVNPVSSDFCPESFWRPLLTNPALGYPEDQFSMIMQQFRTLIPL